jgi:hypothetical protein
MMRAMPQRPNHEDRRQSPRFEVDGRVRARLEPPAHEVIVRDISLGGFLVESHTAFAVDARHEFQIALENDRRVTVLTARSVHCRPRSAPGEPLAYLTGFAFIEPQGTDAQASLRELVKHAATVVRF